MRIKLSICSCPKEKYGKPCDGHVVGDRTSENFVDASDPDLALGQIHHAMQTAEHMRAHNLPEWLYYWIYS